MATILSLLSSGTQAKGFDVIGHRGAPNLRPEHSYESYLLAQQNGADYIEFDVMPSKDGILMCTHSFELDEVTNVASVAKFADRKKTKTVEFKTYTGWFIEDFTAAELQELRLKERYPNPRGTKFDTLFVMPTLEEAIRFVNAITPSSITLSNQKIKLYIETKHPKYFANVLNVEVNQLLVNELSKFEYLEWTMFQSFESTSLIAIRKILQDRSITPLGYVMLVDVNRTQFDTNQPYSEYLTEEGIRKIANFGGTGIGPHYSLVTKEWVEKVHANNLITHPYTFRSEPYFMQKTPYSSFKDMVTTFIEIGVDGIFTEDLIQTREILSEYQNNGIRNVIMALTIIAIAIIAIVTIASVVTACVFKRRKQFASSTLPETVSSQQHLTKSSNGKVYGIDESAESDQARLIPNKQ